MHVAMGCETWQELGCDATGSTTTKKKEKNVQVDTQAIDEMRHITNKKKIIILLCCSVTYDINSF